MNGSWHQRAGKSVKGDLAARFPLTLHRTVSNLCCREQRLEVTNLQEHSRTMYARGFPFRGRSWHRVDKHERKLSDVVMCAKHFDLPVRPGVFRVKRCTVSFPPKSEKKKKTKPPAPPKAPHINAHGSFDVAKI